MIRYAAFMMTALFCLTGSAALADSKPGGTPAPAQTTLIRTPPPWLVPPETPSGPMAVAVQGVWSDPDCTDAKAVMVFSRDYILSLERGKPNLNPVRHWRSEEFDGETLYNYRTSNQDNYLFKITNDGLMKHVGTFVHPQQPLKNAWGGTEDSIASEYSRCAKLFSGAPTLSQDEVNLPFLLDQIREACGQVKPDDFARATSCHAALFETLDSNADQNLDAAELARLYRQGVFLSSATGSACTAGTPAWPGTVQEDSKDFATQILTAMDSDKNQSLSRNDIAKGLNSPLAAKTRDSLLDLLRRSRSLLPFMPLSDAERVCTGPQDSAVDERFTGQIHVKTPAPSPLNPVAEGGCGCAVSAPAE